jgi:aerobic-type carbon monoxide dehydrogenase small subunit (CoxS/CutS family)
MSTIRLAINGRSYTVDADPQTSLLNVLREQLDLTGSKYGCGEGLCGACTVLVEGKAMRSCITKVSAIAQKQITTIEGLATGERLHPVQEAFLEAGAMQCGYCTSGMIMSAVALLGRNSQPSRSDIIDFMDGNVCRCGTHARILSAIEKAARVMRSSGLALQGSAPDARVMRGGNEPADQANEEGRPALIATQTTRRNAVAPPGPSLGKERLVQDDNEAFAGKGARR